MDKGFSVASIVLKYLSLYYSVIPAQSGIHTPDICNLKQDPVGGLGAKIDSVGVMDPCLRRDDKCFL